jgi:hypothetical protein
LSKLILHLFLSLHAAVSAETISLLAPIIPWVTDSDNDGILDAVEDQIGTNKFSADSDGDGIPCVHFASILGSTTAHP